VFARDVINKSLPIRADEHSFPNGWAKSAAGGNAIGPERDFPSIGPNLA